MAELNDKFEFEQDGKTYSLYELLDGFVIEGDVNLSYEELTELPDLSKVTVKGDFLCRHNQLTSLTGAPQKVGGVFRCENNQLTSLTEAPQEVGGDFYCGYNQLTSLEGAPQKVGGDFWCSDNSLVSLQGAPREVGGDFICGYNQLTSLQGAPQKVGGYFDCDNNSLISLQGAPQEVGGYFYCSYNNNLFSLFGLPQMQEDKGIYCDDDLMERYNCPKKEDEYNYYYIEYKDLIESAKYQSELSLHKILQKKHEERAQNDTARKEKLKAGFEAFMKMQTEERE